MTPYWKVKEKKTLKSGERRIRYACVLSGDGAKTKTRTEYPDRTYQNLFFVRRRTARAKIVRVFAKISAGTPIKWIAREERVDPKTIRKWIKRWLVFIKRKGTAFRNDDELREAVPFRELQHRDILHGLSDLLVKIEMRGSLIKAMRERYAEARLRQTEARKLSAGQ